MDLFSFIRILGHIGLGGVFGNDACLDLNLISQNPSKKKVGTVVSTCGARIGKAEIGRSLGLAGQSA